MIDYEDTRAHLRSCHWVGGARFARSATLHRYVSRHLLRGNPASLLLATENVRFVIGQNGVVSGATSGCKITGLAYLSNLTAAHSVKIDTMLAGCRGFPRANGSHDVLLSLSGNSARLEVHTNWMGVGKVKAVTKLSANVSPTR